MCVSEGDTPYQRVVADVPEEWVIELDEQAETAGKSRADLIRTAIREYLDEDRAARLAADMAEVMSQLDRIEGTLADGSTHTHTSTMSGQDGPTTATSETVQRTFEIAQRLQSNHEGPLLEKTVNRAIKDIAGGDPRTVAKYQTELKERDHAYEHFDDDNPSWYLDREQWLDDMADYLEHFQTPQKRAMQAFDEYDFELADVLDDRVSEEFNEVITNEH
jgi:Arc/MetJ-type ribon-helix-helix transcriptional regulator